MARIRTIKPEFFTSEDIVSLSFPARLLYIALWCEADREGRMAWRPSTFKLRYFPGDKVDIHALARELIARGLVIEYGDGLAYIPKFSQHQHVNPREAHSSLPVPDASARVTDTQVGREGRKEGKGKEGDIAPDATRRAPKVNGHSISFNFNEGKFDGIAEQDELRWQEAFPAVPIPPAIERAAAWLRANPANRKSNYERFLVNWFTREQDRAARVK